MYYPYLRGRQNELLCIRELLEAGNLSKKVIPVIEPVRFNSTFFATLSRFIEQDRDIIVIQNPKVGKFDSDFLEMKKKMEKEVDHKKKEKLKCLLDSYLALLQDKHVLVAYISDNTVIRDFLDNAKPIDESIVINCEKGDYKYYEEYGDKLKARLTFVPKDEDFRDEVYGDAVILEDGYVKAKRNIDYIDSPDEFFSRNHVVFQKRGYVGFSDYSIVGGEYDESGFAPLAIAIHIMYFGKKDELRVHHFVSESNENMSDPARKFEEAMKSLLNWEFFESIPKTVGLDKLITYYSTGKFPGLGVIKKYSLMHHVEIVGNYLEEK